MEPAKKLRSTACVTLFFNAMRSYKIESYVPENTFFGNKSKFFCRALFDNCFVVDVSNNNQVLAAGKSEEPIPFSMATAATLLTLFDSNNEFFILPHNNGTLILYPAWRQLKFALVFYFKESTDEVQKTYQNAERYAFSALFDTENEDEFNQRLPLETKLCALRFYMDHLFGDKRETNVTAHILMIANLAGCRLQKMSVPYIDAVLSEADIERLDAYLFCTFLTMRRYNGKVSAQTDENAENLTHGVQKYGFSIQQSVQQRGANATAFDFPSPAAMASFAEHPYFKKYKIEEVDSAIRLHIPLFQKAILSSFGAHKTQKEIILNLFPIQ